MKIRILRNDDRIAPEHERNSHTTKTVLRHISTATVSNPTTRIYKNMLFCIYRKISTDEPSAGCALPSLNPYTEQMSSISSEYCFYVDADESCREAVMLKVLKWLLAETFAPDMAAGESFLGTPARYVTLTKFPY
jgi:hypothetical protein